MELECIEYIEIIKPFLLPQGETAVKVVSLHLLSHIVILIIHLHRWVDIGCPIFVCKQILNGKLTFLLVHFLLFGLSQVESNNFSVLWEGEMFKWHKVFVILRVQSSCRDQVTYAVNFMKLTRHVNWNSKIIKKLLPIISEGHNILIDSISTILTLKVRALCLFQFFRLVIHSLLTLETLISNKAVIFRLLHLYILK